jgi:hypothetical protein
MDNKDNAECAVAKKATEHMRTPDIVYSAFRLLFLHNF